MTAAAQTESAPDERQPTGKTTKPPPPRRRRLRRRLLGLAIGLVIGLLLAEGLLRGLGYSPASVNPLRSFHRADPVLVYRGRENIEGRFRREQFDVTVRHDEHGFRMPESTRDPKEVDRTVHVFGDSFTWGWGVETGEVFTDHLRRRLARQAVKNYGINASGTALQTKLLETEVRESVRPGDRIVLMFFYNDFFDNTHETRLHGRVEGDRVVEVTPESDFGPSFGRWLKEVSYLANFAAHVWDLRKAKKRAVEQRAAGETRGAGPGPAERKVTTHFLRRFRELVAELRAELTVVWICDSRDVAGRAEGHPSVYFDAFREVAEAAGIVPIDPTAAFVTAMKADPAPLYFDGDDHWTPRGHAVIAEVLANQLR
ncbi:MAG: SGNH/GDSL hydrolase family protein [bacterium]|nr:SGNH/GDSL hydrolase family protein [bacterium]